MARANIHREPWERQEGESARAFEAFAKYRDMGASRNLRAVGQEVGKSRGTIEKWSSLWKWVDRSAAWDAEQDRIARQEQINEIKKMRKRHADLATAMLVKSAKALQRIPDDEIRAGDISRMVDVASKLERISRGDVETVVEERQGENQPSAVTFYMPSNGRNDPEVPEDEIDTTER